ncbi:MAG: integrin alpha [Deltaproteobacteria bacterium]|nr:integrin alpha [Deltaproteobacteria bacterium]
MQRPRVILTVLSILSCLASTGSAQLSPQDSYILSQGNGLPGLPEDFESTGKVVVRGDFNGDLWDDLAIGVPNESVGSQEDAGAVIVAYGGPQGLGVAHSQLFTQNSPGIPGVAESDDEFGSTLVVGDFNLDLIDDLAVGAPREDIGNIIDAGAAAIIFGGPDGLDGSTSIEVLDPFPNLSEQFGHALAAHQFGLQEPFLLFVGAPGEQVGSIAPGGVLIFQVDYQAPEPVAFHLETIHQDTQLTPTAPAIPGVNEHGDRFGHALAIDRLQCGQGPPWVDLAIGGPGEDIGSGSSGEDAGAVWVIQIKVENFSVETATSLLFLQGDGEISGTSENGDQFGYSLASGDIGGFQQEQLIIGVPFEDVFGTTNQGSIHTLGLTGCDLGEKLVMDGSVLGGPNVAFSQFGFSVHAADLNGDRKEELIIGAPNELHATGQGTLSVFYLDPDGFPEFQERLAPTGAQRFGNTIASGRFFTRDGPLALAVGDPLLLSPDQEGPRTGGVMLIPNQEIFSDGFESFNTLRWTLTVP